jgi:hypothetical protein
MIFIGQNQKHYSFFAVGKKILFFDAEEYRENLMERFGEFQEKGLLF